MASRTGIFGGTFDPVHEGHREAARSFLKSGLLDKLLVLPAHTPPHKSGKGITDLHHRMQMLEIAFREFGETVRISDLESRLPQPGYTINSVLHLQRHDPETVFYLCIGEDSLHGFEGWFRYEELISLVPLLVVSRPGFETGKTGSVSASLLERAVFVEHHPNPASSTGIRELRSRGENGPESHFLSPAVYDYLQQNQLYEVDSGEDDEA